VYTFRLKGIVLFFLVSSILLSTLDFGVVSAQESALVTVSVNELPSEYSTRITMDGKEVGSIQGGGSKEFEVDKKSSHIFQVEDEIAGASLQYEGVKVSTRYSCLGNSWTLELVEKTVREQVPVYYWVWDDSLCEWVLQVYYEWQTRTVKEFAEQGHVFEYITEHELFVKDPHGEETREWLEEGTSASFSVKEEVVSIKDGERDVFQHWLVNDVHSNNPVSLEMDKPYVAIAKYVTEYRLDVGSEIGTASGSGWYQAGQVAKMSITPETVPMESPWGLLGAKYRFDGWSGQGDVPANPTVSVTMNRPLTYTARWCCDVTLTVVCITVIIVVVCCCCCYYLLRRPRLKPSRWSLWDWFKRPSPTVRPMPPPPTARWPKKPKPELPKPRYQGPRVSFRPRRPIWYPGRGRREEPKAPRVGRIESQPPYRVEKPPPSPAPPSQPPQFISPGEGLPTGGIGINYPCPKCGWPIPVSDTFCSRCGSPR